MASSGSRQSSSTTLPPINFVDNFARRGSITDPVLHTSTPPPPTLQQPRAMHIESSSRLPINPSPHAVRPTSPYRFGSATADSNHLRRILHSPDPSSTRSASGPSQGSSSEHLDAEINDLHAPRHRQDGPQFDYTMRRHSIATVHLSDPPRASSPSDRLRRPPLAAGSSSLKRKISHDGLMFSSVGEEGSTDDGEMSVDSVEPAAKRRGSTFDTRIAHLSLYDRRDSIDSRSPASQVWGGDRRDSAASVFSTASSVGTGYTSGFSTDSNVKSLQSYSWAAAASSSNSEAHGNEAGHTSRSPGPRGPSTPGDLPTPSEHHPMPTVPSMHPYASDRRMSVPDSSSRAMDRSLRSRSRPPMSTRGVESATSPTRLDHDLPSIRGPDIQRDPTPTASEHPGDATPGPTSNSALAPPGQMSTTPYSRSPELRVSHKLAERKRRKEMKDLFDELREHLPADRGMKASKWEILSKAVDYIQTLKRSEANLQREVDMLRHELDSVRQSAAQFAGGLQATGVGHPIVYTQGPPIAPYPPGAPVNAGGRSAVMHGYGHGAAASVGNGTPPM